MTEPAETYALKEIFNRERLRHIATQAATVVPAFDIRRFMRLATADLESLSIMQRMRRVATSLRETLPGGFANHLDVLREMAPRMDHSFAAISLSEYVALYGVDPFDRSMETLAWLTRFGSSEFAVRTFLLHDLERALATMRRWADDDNEHVRRLASEGCRPRLPWSFHIKALLDDPAPVAPILEALRSDPSLYVRKSVANHLNDITKDHADWVIERIGTWPRDNVHTAWIVKRALRTLIKKGDTRALAVIGASRKAEVSVEGFSASPSSLRLGERVTITARLVSTAAEAQRLVVDYAVHYVRKSDTSSRKVFKLKEVDLAAGAGCDLSISQVVKDFTTRKHHAGHHKLELMVNGEVLAVAGFDLAL